MKHTPFLLATFFAFGFTADATAQSECGPVKYMRQALASAIAKGLIDDRVPSGFHRDVCIFGGYMLESESLSFTMTLEGGTKYGFVGGGDDDVTDLDIYLYNSRGVEVAKDAKTNNYPVTTYTPASTGRYTVKVKMFSTKTRGSFASLIIKSDDGYTIPLTILAGAASNLVSIVEQFCEPPVKTMSFLANQWALYGCVLGEGESKTISKVQLSSSKGNAILSTGDQNATDVDLFLYDSDGDLLAEDPKPRKHAAVAHMGDVGSTYQLKMKNARCSEDKSLIMSAILEIEIE